MRKGPSQGGDHAQSWWVPRPSDALPHADARGPRPRPSTVRKAVAFGMKDVAIRWRGPAANPAPASGKRTIYQKLLDCMQSDSAGIFMGKIGTFMGKGTFMGGFTPLVDPPIKIHFGYTISMT